MAHARKPRRVRAAEAAKATEDPVIKLQDKLFKLGYVTADRHLLASVHALIDYANKTRGPVPAMLLQGPPGTGKTFLAETVQKLWEAQEFFSFPFTPGVTKEDLMYDLNIANIAAAQSGRWQGEFTDKHSVRMGVFAQALVASREHRTVLLLDELDKANDKVDAFMLEYLQATTMEAGPLGRLHGNPRNLLVFVTMNNQRQLTEPLMRRFGPLRVELKWPTPDVETKLVGMMAMKVIREGAHPTRLPVKRMAANIVKLANEVRSFGKQLKKVPSSPELALALAACDALPQQDWGHIVYAALLAYDGDRQVAQSIWRKGPDIIGAELVR